MTTALALRCIPFLAAAALALAACDRGGDRSAGQKLDSAVQKVEQKADELKARVDVGADKAAAEVREAARNVKEAGTRAAQQAGGTVDDALITTAVKGELARDPKLNALAIDVDTHAGRVLLRGSAPDDGSRLRATTLAAGTKGVSGVDNQLVVQPAVK